MSATQISKILVPVDFSDASDQAAVYARALSRRLGASLYLIHVLPTVVPHGPLGPGASTPGAERLYQESRSRLADLAVRLGDATPPIATEVRAGDPAESIGQAAVHYGADLVIMATHGRTGLAHLLAGSVAEDVVRTAPCPVMVLRESGKIDVHRSEQPAKVA